MNSNSSGFDQQLGINWDESNINTLNVWIKECNKQQFIYESVLETVITQAKIFKIFILILCAVQSVVTVTNLGLNEVDHYYAVWFIKVFVSVVSAITYILTQIMTLEKFEELVKNYTLYIESLDIFMSNMVSMADIKIELRPDGDKFILENKETYSMLYRKSPYIKKSYWEQGMKNYINYLKTISTVDVLDSTNKSNVIIRTVRSILPTFNKTPDKLFNYHSRKRRIYDRFALMDCDILLHKPPDQV